ncbi:hypothetical protein [Roseovarius sp. TE539]|uniref:hypothetical protein n=1 Tax=Roseovarius sp. TE539 TaxID=2249812 RepID=UPI0015EF897D|nr:hypothetical protein [Roseovarius sp. TE539]
MRQVIRYTLGALMFAVSPIIYLNIEVWAAQHELDQILAGRIPGWLLAFILQPWIFWLSLVLMGFACGVWLDAILRKRPKAIARQVILAERCQNLANEIKVKLKGMHPYGSPPMLLSKYQILKDDLAKEIGVLLPAYDGRSGVPDFLIKQTAFLELIAPYLYAERGKDFVESYSGLLISEDRSSLSTSEPEAKTRH